MSASLHRRSRLSATATVSGESSPGCHVTTVTERGVEAALADPQVDRALRIFGRDDVRYRDLYDVYEIAVAAVGLDIYADGTVTKAEVGRFKRTANSVHVLGDEARHGRERHDPPPHPMSFPDAKALVGRILWIWLSAIRSG